MKYIPIVSLLAFFTLTSIAQVNAPTDYINCEQKAFTSKMNFKASPETNNYDIIYHRILWKIDPAVKYIQGEVTSHFKALENDMAFIYFDLINALSVDSVKHNNTLLTVNHTNNLVKITLPNVLNEGDIDSVTVYYKGTPQTLTGFGAFETDVHNGAPILWTLSEPYGAREWWPCKQSLTDKIDSIDIYVETPSVNKVGSNGKLMFENIDGDTKLTWWKHRYPIASYLVAIAVTNYASYSHYAMVNETDSVEILNYVYPENLSSASTQTEFTVTVVELFSNLFIPYPFSNEKYGHAQFGWGGGMEHQTMSFMGGFSESLITHELAHQWFGNHVTCNSWQHIWVNEGFAVFCECLAQEHLYPANLVSWKANKMSAVLAYGQSGSIFVEDTSNVYRIFDGTLTYKKGGLMLQMLRNQIGDEGFFTGIKELLIDPKTSGGFASANDVQQYLEVAADTNLTTFFNDWYYGEGYPNYTIKWAQNLDNKISLNISQITTHSSVPFFAMHVPILLKGSGQEKLVTFHNIQNNQDFTYNADFIVDEIVFDPYYNIISNHPANIVLNIVETIRQTQITLMPNPANEMIIVKSANNSKFSSLDIIDLAGKHVYSSSFNGNKQKTQVNISSLPVGIYYMRINTKNGLIIKKFIKSN